MSSPDTARGQRRRRPDRARRAAFDALRAVNGDGAYANLAMPALLRERRLTGRDAAFATELLAGTCRWQGSYDTIIAAAAGRPLKEFQPAVVDLLRLGAHQILAMRVPTPAAVAAGVDLAAATVGERVTGLVNAVLRRIAERSLDEWLDQLSAGLDDHDRLALRTAHPRWIVDAYAELLEPSELEQALAANNHSPAISLAVRPGLAEVDDLVRAGAEPSGYSPFAARWRGDPAELALVRDGRAGVQDEGSQLVTWALTRRGRSTGLVAGPLRRARRQVRAAGRPGPSGWQQTAGSGPGAAPGAAGRCCATRLCRRRIGADSCGRRRYPASRGAPTRLPGCWPMCRVRG